MGTFTIYNCGTGYDETNRDLITKLFEKTQGARGTDKLICAGPGSKLMTRPDYDPTLHPSRYSFQTSVFTPVKNAYQGMGKLTGATDAVKQVEFNVAAVLKILKGLRIKPGTRLIWPAGVVELARAMPLPMPWTTMKKTRGLRVWK